MAKKVIQMYDKYKSTTKIYPKVIKDCFQDDAKEYIEGQVVANPELAGTEASLTGLEVGGTKYKVEQPINVEANPTLAGTEADLESIEIGNTKYKVGGGKTLYEHIITVTASTDSHVYVIQVINDSNTSIDTLTKLINYFYNKLGTTKVYPASGGNLYGNLGFTAQYIEMNDSTHIRFIGMDKTGSLWNNTTLATNTEGFTVTDTVTAL